jgi:hypothetical protein
MKDNRIDEEKGSRWISPFANYISIIEAFIQLNSRIVETGV